MGTLTHPNLSFEVYRTKNCGYEVEKPFEVAKETEDTIQILAVLFMLIKDL